MRICFIGDSFVNGTGDDSGLGWVGRVSAAARGRGCDLTHYNLGIRGDTSTLIAARWEREVQVRLPRDDDGRLVFSFGINDCVMTAEGQRRVAESVSLATTRDMLGAAKASWPCLMIGPPPTGNDALDTRVAALSQGFASLCATLAIPYFSPWDALRTDGTWLREVAAGDGAHPNHRGYESLAALIDAWLPWRSWVDAGMLSQSSLAR
jgi:acyl-CoA thioesterase I